MPCASPINPANPRRALSTWPFNSTRGVPYYVCDQLHLIDFDDAGFGWHLYEPAVALNGYRDRDLYPEFAMLCCPGTAARATCRRAGASCRSVLQDAEYEVSAMNRAGDQVALTYSLSLRQSSGQPANSQRFDS